jgi:tetratricopeptide (TPR) repeat protein
MNRALAGLLAITLAQALTSRAQAAPIDDAVADLQRDWEVIRYQLPPAEREKRFEALAAKAHKVSETFAGRSEPLVWEGIIVSSLAGEKGGLGALGLVKQAKATYERAIEIDGNVLDGSAYNSLGVLYYKVPGWPVGFGDKAKARQLLQKALTLNPQGIDPNFFYAEYLVETQHADEALPYLERALQAPPRPGRQIADAGRKQEARALLAKVKAN